jgi:hypothetical protein
MLKPSRHPANVILSRSPHFAVQHRELVLAKAKDRLRCCAALAKIERANFLLHF